MQIHVTQNRSSQGEGISTRILDGRKEGDKTTPDVKEQYYIME